MSQPQQQHKAHQAPQAGAKARKKKARDHAKRGVVSEHRNLKVRI